MPILQDFERRLGGLVEGLFAKTFRSGLQPIELAKRVLREMDSRKTVGVRGTWAPNNFVFSLSAPDFKSFEQAERALRGELEQVVRDHAAERGWGLVGPPHVEFVADEELKKGEFRCDASLAQGEEREDKAEPRSERGASIVITEDGVTRSVSLSADTATIGRLPECDVVLRDKSASRRHAQIQRKGNSYTLTDLGSTNGTRLNGETVQMRTLSDGDRITIGTTVLEFREET